MQSDCSQLTWTTQHQPSTYKDLPSSTPIATTPGVKETEAPLGPKEPDAIYTTPLANRDLQSKTGNSRGRHFFGNEVCGIRKGKRQGREREKIELTLACKIQGSNRVKLKQGSLIFLPHDERVHSLHLLPSMNPKALEVHLCVAWLSSILIFYCLVGKWETDMLHIFNLDFNMINIEKKSFDCDFFLNRSWSQHRSRSRSWSRSSAGRICNHCNRCGLHQVSLTNFI